MDKVNSSLALYFSAFKHSKEAILISNRNGELVAVNQACCDMLGYTKEEMLTKQVDDLLPNRFLHSHKNHRESYYQDPQNRSMGEGYELFAKKADDSEVPVNVGLTHITENDKLYVIAFLVDISQQVSVRKKLEKLNSQLEQRVAERTQELATIINTLEEANARVKKTEQELRVALSQEKELGDLKSRFVTLASHEFRTPLSTILSSASLIEKYKGEEENDKRQKHINRIKNNVHTLTNILSDFLSFEKLQNGVITVMKEQINIKEFIENCVDEFKQSSTPNLSISINHSGLSIIETDISLLGNAIKNLISNAVKYSKENGIIELNLTVEEEQCEFSVVDNGVGIPANELKYLFTQFFRANNVTNIQGTGLGLNISKQFVELLNGTISVESEENTGSIFTIQLPLV